MKDLSASLVLYKTNEKLLSRVIESFCNNHHLQVDLFIVDNSPTQNLTYLKIINDYPNVNYVYLGKNIGYGNGNNFAIKSRKYAYKYHLVLNPDIYFDGSILIEIFDFMEKNSNIGLLMPKVLYEDNRLQYLCKMLPTPKIWISRALLGKAKLTAKWNFNFEYRFFEYDKIALVPYLSGCFMFLRNSVFNSVGFFDENIFLHTEDVDFSRRIFEKFDNVYYPFVEVHHEFNKETYKSSKVLFYHIRSTLYYFNKWGWFFDNKRKLINKKILSGDFLYSNYNN